MRRATQGIAGARLGGWAARPGWPTWLPGPGPRRGRSSAGSASSSTPCGGSCPRRRRHPGAGRRDRVQGSGVRRVIPRGRRSRSARCSTGIGLDGAVEPRAASRRCASDWDRTLDSGDDGTALRGGGLHSRGRAAARSTTGSASPALFNKAGEPRSARGFSSRYHNHDFEFVPSRDGSRYDVLLAETDPRLVQLEMDLYWITKGGQDPLDVFRQVAGRFPAGAHQGHGRDRPAVLPRSARAPSTSGASSAGRSRRASGTTSTSRTRRRALPSSSAKASYQYLQAWTF